MLSFVSFLSSGFEESGGYFSARFTYRVIEVCVHASNKCVILLLRNIKQIGSLIFLLMCRFLMLSSILEVSAENLIQIFDGLLKCYTSPGNLIFDTASGFL